MKKLFIFLALTQQGFCLDNHLNDTPLGEDNPPYTSMVFGAPPGEGDFLASLSQRSYVANTRSFDEDMELTQQDLNQWLNLLESTHTTPN